MRSRNLTGFREFSLSPCEPISFLGPPIVDVTRKVLFLDLFTALQLATFKPLHMLDSAMRSNLTGYPFII